MKTDGPSLAEQLAYARKHCGLGPYYEAVWLQVNSLELPPELLAQCPNLYPEHNPSLSDRQKQFIRNLLDGALSRAIDKMEKAKFELWKMHCKMLDP